MKTLLAVLFLSQMLIGALCAEKVTLLVPPSSPENPSPSSDTITLLAGDTLQVLSVSTASTFALVKIGTIEVQAHPVISGYSGYEVAATRNPIIVAGPAEVRFVNAGFATVEIKRAGEAPTTGPLNTVVIPENATGPVTVLLESSTDLLTWTPVLPGTYSSSTNRRFFRVRAVAP